MALSRVVVYGSVIPNRLTQRNTGRVQLFSSTIDFLI